ncbi:MAG: type II toxin-antitoxin system VapC family toxin [Tagaea sp.]|nr:type II toxin-antitoxin system VapC family toxin [Tagaea sp.]
MKLLLDTHVYLWIRGEPARISRATSDALRAAETVWVSIASAWEAEIKVGKGNLTLGETFAYGIADAGFELLPITLDHVERLRDLPLHHKDPFDRMLVAQALAERATLVTVDRHFARYGIKLMAA